MRKASKQDEKREKQLSSQEIANTIIRYLKDHPKASDTLEGIAEWWIMRQQVWVKVKTLREVLDLLVERGVLEAIGKGDDRTFRLKSKK